MPKRNIIVTNINIDDCSIILTHSFIYDEDVVNSEDDIGEFPNIDNLLSYVKAINKEVKVKSKIFTHDNITLYGKKENIAYNLNIEDTKIYFFDNNIAFLYIKITPTQKDLESLYNINRMLTSLYKKDRDSYVYIGKKTPFKNKPCPTISTTKKKSIEYLKVNNSYKKYKAYINELINKISENTIENKYFFEDDRLKIKFIKNTQQIWIEIVKYDTLTKAILKLYVEDNKEIFQFYTPHNEDKSQRDYPLTTCSLDDEVKGRVGLTKDEKKKLSENSGNKHYWDIEKHIFAVEEEKDIYSFINYDTFITSLILKYVKHNDSIFYFDNFNPLATKYINSYITLTCESKVLDDEYENNFISFEPLLSSKVNKGNKLTNADYFNIYQSQVDMFTIGNAHNIVHILDTKAKDIKANKEQDHFHTYLLTNVQRVFILNIINNSISHNKNILGTGIREIINKYNIFSMTRKKFTNFMTNYNFQVISNSSSIDKSYSFFRKCNDIDKLFEQWRLVSARFTTWRDVIAHISKVHPVLLVLFVALIPIVIKLLNLLLNKFIDIDYINLLGSVSSILSIF
jgi:hypothetical protein